VVDVIKPFKPSLSQGQILSLSRWGIVVLGLGSLALAIFLKGVINALLFAYTIYTCGLILPVIAGFYKNRLRVTPLGALAAIIGGGLAALIGKLLDIKYLDLGSLLISGLLLFMISFIDNMVKGRKL
jgi:SSS family solute:Na+ symporter